MAAPMPDFEQKGALLVPAAKKDPPLVRDFSFSKEGHLCALGTDGRIYRFEREWDEGVHDWRETWVALPPLPAGG